MSSDKISLKFHGRDFTRIIDDLEENIFLNSTRSLNKDEQLIIILKFLEFKNDEISKLIIDSGKQQELSKDKKKIYSLFQDEYWWSGLVGIITGGIPHLFESDLRELDEENGDNTDYGEIEVTIQIQSRFDIDVSGKKAKPYFLSTMLMKCHSGMNDNFVPNNSDDFFFDLLLLYLFKEKAKQCYVKGLYKTYHRFEKNDDHLKGAIDISRHIRLNMGLGNGKIAYSYKENTVDNYLNHIIICAFEKLKVKYPESVIEIYNDTENAYFKFLVETLKSKISYPTYDTRTLIAKNLVGLSHPYYMEYEDLRIISLKVLRDEGISLFDGKSDEVNGILFYIPDLWELYLENLLVDQKYNLHTQGYHSKSIDIINYEDDLLTFKQKTNPDYVFSFSLNSDGQSIDKPFMILDAKFKPDWGEIIFGQKSISPVLQDYDKCVRDMTSINAHACGAIFPTNIDMSSKIMTLVKHDVSEFNSIDKFYTFPLIVPVSDNANQFGYSKWFDEFKEKNKLTIELIKTHVLNEQKFAFDNYKILKEIETLRNESKKI